LKYLSSAAVDLCQLRSNYNTICDLAAPARVIAVVKADAYGHGAIECAKALYDAGARYFAVANLAEALEIKPHIGDSGLLILGATSPDDVNELIDNGISQTVYSLDYARALCNNIPSGKRLICHLKLDTGMNRLGFEALYKENISSPSLLQMIEVCTMEKLCFEGVFTHFAQSDTPSSDMTDMQFERFTITLDALKKAGITFSIRHASNSAAIYNYKNTHLDMVRAGIVLYGFDPSPDTSAIGCKPIMTLKTTVTHVHTLKKGEGVGYGSTYIAERDMKIATLAIGYADGFVRAYSGTNSLSGEIGSVYIKGKEAPIVGRICMDQCTVCVDGIEVNDGDEAIVFDSVHTADRLARAANTINYEVTSILTRRVKREYIR